MIKQFKYKNIDVTVDTEKYSISYKDPDYSSLTRVWVCDWVETELNSNSIVVKPKRHHEDNGVIYKNSKEYFPNLPSRSFTNNNLTITGIGQFDFFAGLTNQPISIKEIFSRALINNQLENLTEIFGESIPCWNAYSNWEFFTPIETELTLYKSDENLENNNSVKLDIVNIDSPDFTITLLDANNNPLEAPIAFANPYINEELDSGKYSLLIKSNVDTGAKLISFEILENTQEV